MFRQEPVARAFQLSVPFNARREIIAPLQLIAAAALPLVNNGSQYCAVEYADEAPMSGKKKKGLASKSSHQPTKIALSARSEPYGES